PVRGTATRAAPASSSTASVTTTVTRGGTCCRSDRPLGCAHATGGGQRSGPFGPPYLRPMDRFVVRPGPPLEGSVAIGGAKNSALKLLAATILAPGEHVLHNVPRIADV